MRISEASPEQRRDIIRRIAKGYGELVTLNWKECPNELGENCTDVSDEFYIGKMTPGQTGTILTIVIAAIINGLDFQKAHGRNDMLSFVNSLAGDHVSVFLGAVLSQSAEWVEENFDATWLITVGGTFLAHNDFLTLLQMAATTAQKFGLNLESLSSLTQGFSLGGKSRTE